MDTAVRTPLEVFNLPQRLTVPLFQRPYVWDEERQWHPLWQDIRRLAERLVDVPWEGATHFLGAIVLQAQPNQAGQLQTRSVIDGQQRLTTLQLLLDAVAALFEVKDLENLAGQLDGLTQNSSHFVSEEQDRLKLSHSNQDRSAFEEVMQADPPVDYESLKHAKTLIVRAHRYFTEQVDEWLSADGDIERRAEALTAILTRALQLVVIDLRSDENSQEIFETLNARGTPLTAADLIKNHVFQRLAAEGVDTAKAYVDQWRFDDSFWEREVSVGRYPVSRSSLFFNQWLIARTGEEIGPTSTFSRFRHYVEHEAQSKMADLLPVIAEQADEYRRWIERAADPHSNLNRLELSVYRTQSADIETVKPILIWLTEPDSPYKLETIEAVVGMVESWLLRRTLLRLSISDFGRLVADVISTGRAAPDAELAARVEAVLRRQAVASMYWPGDEELRAGLISEAVFRRLKRGRMRMVLKAVEDHLRGFTGTRPAMAGMRVPRLGYPVEHLLPQKWATNWPVEGLQAELERDDHVHRLGNLTLITSSLNSSISNGPWLGPNGKREKLARHDVLLLNRDVNQHSADGWDEERIDARSLRLIDAIIATWPVPDGHQGKVVDSTAGRDQTGVTLKHLVAAGLLMPGTRLVARQGVWGGKEAEVLPSGDLQMDGKVFSSPSAAGHHLRGGATNGWWFWSLPDGRRLKELRTEYSGEREGT